MFAFSIIDRLFCDLTWWFECLVMPLKPIDCSPPKSPKRWLEQWTGKILTYVISPDGTFFAGVVNALLNKTSAIWGEVAQTHLFSIIFPPAKTAKSARSSHGDGRPKWKQTYSASLRLRWNKANASVGTTRNWTIFTCIHHHTHKVDSRFCWFEWINFESTMHRITSGIHIYNYIIYI